MAMMFWHMASKPSILFRNRCTGLASNKMVGQCLESVWTVLDPTRIPKFGQSGLPDAMEWRTWPHLHVSSCHSTL